MGVEVSNTGVEWVDKQIKQELDALQSSKFDKNISINYLKNLNKNSYKEMMSKNSGATVVAIQVLLKEAGYDVGKVDGILKGKGKVTSKTIEAVRAFQRKNGLNPDGAPGPLTVNKLLELYGKGGGKTGGNEQAKENDEKVKDLTEKEYEALCKKTSLTDDEVKQIVKYSNKNSEVVKLINLKKITDKQAEILSKVNRLHLDGLTSITDKQAESLGKVGVLRLDGLTSITDRQVESLSKVQRLYLNGLISITDQQAESLGKVKDTLSLNGLISITDQQAESLGKEKELLWLNGLKSITDKQAESLSKVKMLPLNGLTKITDRQAKSLSKVELLSLNGLTSITDKQAESLGKVKDTLLLKGLTSITDKQATELAKVKVLEINKKILTLKQKQILKKHISS